MRFRSGLFALAAVLFGGAIHAQAPKPNFSWFAELVSSDTKGATLTTKARIEPHIAAYIGRFKPGDRIAMVWTQFSGNADAVRYVAAEKDMAAETGFIVRGTFVSADPAAKTLTFTTAAPAAAIATLTSARAGTPIRVSARLLPGATTVAALSAVALNVKAPPRPAPVVKKVDDTARPVAGSWAVETALMGNPAKLTCTFTQQGKKIGGICTGPGPLKDLEVSGAVDGDAVTFQFTISQGPVTLPLLHRGTLNAAGNGIEGTSNLMGQDSPFKATKQ